MRSLVPEGSSSSQPGRPPASAVVVLKEIDVRGSTYGNVFLPWHRLSAAFVALHKVVELVGFLRSGMEKIILLCDLIYCMGGGSRAPLLNRTL